MGSAVTKQEKTVVRRRIKTPRDLRKLSLSTSVQSVGSVRSVDRTSPSEISVSAKDLQSDQINFIDYSNISDENSVKSFVAKTWRKIDGQSTQIKEEKPKKPLDSSVVRVFVSSTFVDCHSERNILVKEVFPELRDWCAERGLSLIDVDLRWGVPAETSTSGTIEVCMHELDECHGETNGEPFFISLLGDRYGWIPDGDSVTEHINSAYDWVPNVSVTHMEILYGAYRCRNPNAAFFFRDSKALTKVPAEFRKNFEEQLKMPRIQLQELKQRVRKKFSSACFDYSPTFDGFDENSGRKIVKFGGLVEFGEQVKTFLKQRISVAFNLKESKQEEANDSTKYRYQLQFMQESSAFFVGRSDELKTLTNYVETKFQSKPSNNQKKTQTGKQEKPAHRQPSQNRKAKADQEPSDTKLEGTPYFVVTSASGVGKSALLAKFTEGLLQKYSDKNVFYHFAGLPGADNEEEFLQRLLHFAAVDSDMADRQTLIGIWLEKGLTKLASSENVVVLVLDALEKFSYANDNQQRLQWLSPRFPKNVRCVVSADANHYATISKLDEHASPAFRINLLSLPSNEQMFFVDSYLSRYGKKLDDSQSKALLVEERNLVWLTLACEELRVFGDFRNVKSKITSLPGDVDGLCWYILHRLIGEDGSGEKDVEKFVKYLTCESKGFGESYAPSLLGSMDDAKPAPYSRWNSVKVRLKPFLRFANGVIDFRFNALRQSVTNNLMSSKERSNAVNSELARFYDVFCKSNYHLYIDRYPYFLVRSEQKERAVKFLFVETTTHSINQNVKQQYFKDLRCKDIIISMFKDNNAYVCIFCVDKHSASSRCTICALPLNLEEGLLCMKHSNPHMISCIFCDRFLPSSPAMLELQGSKMMLCTFCNFGIRQCCNMTK